MTFEVGGGAPHLPAVDQIRKLTRLHIGRLQPAEVENVLMLTLLSVM